MLLPQLTFPPTTGALYRLVAVLDHSGSMIAAEGEVGHYVAFVHLDSGWVCCNDDKVKRVDEEDVLKSNWHQALYQKGVGFFFFCLFDGKFF